MTIDDQDYSGFCSLTVYDSKTGECLTSWLIELSPVIEKDTRNVLFRRVRLTYDIGTSGSRVILEGRATGSDDDPDIKGCRTPLQIVVTLIHPQCVTTELTLGAEYGDALRADIRSAHDASPAGLRSQTTSPPEGDDPIWNAFAAILAGQAERNPADISRLRRASALLFHEDGHGSGGRYREIHARANAFLDTLEI